MLQNREKYCWRYYGSWSYTTVYTTGRLVRNMKLVQKRTIIASILMPALRDAPLAKPHFALNTPGQLRYFNEMATVSCSQDINTCIYYHPARIKHDWLRWELRYGLSQVINSRGGEILALRSVLSWFIVIFFLKHSHSNPDNISTRDRRHF